MLTLNVWLRHGRAWRIIQLNNNGPQTAVIRGHPPGPEASIGKLHWANWHRSFGELLVSIMGGGRHDHAGR